MLLLVGDLTYGFWRSSKANRRRHNSWCLKLRKFQYGLGESSGNRNLSWGLQESYTNQKKHDKLNQKPSWLSDGQTGKNWQKGTNRRPGWWLNWRRLGGHYSESSIFEISSSSNVATFLVVVDGDSSRMRSSGLTTNFLFPLVTVRLTKTITVTWKCEVLQENSHVSFQVAGTWSGASTRCFRLPCCCDDG